MAEIWEAIKGYDNYEVSSFGNVKNIKTGKILKAGLNGDGYYHVGLSNHGKKKTCTIHRLVAEAFIDNLYDKPCVDHIDNVRTNNNVSNLRYASFTENCQNQSIKKSNTSGVKGVRFDERYGMWKAQITIDGIRIGLGLFNTIEEAKQARIKRANQAFGIYVNACEKE